MKKIELKLFFKKMIIYYLINILTQQESIEKNKNLGFEPNERSIL